MHHWTSGVTSRDGAGCTTDARLFVVLLPPTDAEEAERCEGRDAAY